MNGKYHVSNLRTAATPAEAVQGGRGAAKFAEINGNTLRETFGAPWRSISLVQLVAGSSLGPRKLDNAEAMVYVTSGTGVARFDGGDVDLHEGTSLALLKGAVLHIENTAKDDPLELFLAEMAVTPATGF